jgi:RNA polymerase nonessential primary-like sigma factor
MTQKLSVDEAHQRRSKEQYEEYKSTGTYSNRISDVKDATRLYLNEIGFCALLTAEEEKYFSRLALKGDEQARHRMIESNLRLVVKIARRYVNSGLTLLDLIEEGNLGLIKAVSKFDPEKGFRFSTYGIWWIRQTIERAIMNQVRTIRLPIHVAKEVNVQLRAARDLTQKLDHEPTLEEIAEYLGKPIKRVSTILNLNQKVGSVDNPLSTDSDTTLLESIPDTGNQGPEKTVLDANLMSNMEQWLDRLSDVQKDVICLRFGLRGNDVGTLEDVAREVGLTREKVRQVQVGALRSLRRTLEVEGLSSSDVLDAEL